MLHLVGELTSWGETSVKCPSASGGGGHATLFRPATDDTFNLPITSLTHYHSTSRCFFRHFQMTITKDTQELPRQNQQQQKHVDKS